MTPGHVAPDLVVLAAGLGRRYGEHKQIADVGPHGEWLLEYAIHDALAAGFGRIVLVVSAPLRDALDERLAPRLRGRAELRFVEQSASKIPSGCHARAARVKPLGTGHALWCCRELLTGAFAVINADDYYGPTAFRLLADHLLGGKGPAMVAFRIDAALSPHGGVNRGVCRVDALGHLSGIAEFTGIRRQDGRVWGTDPGGARVVLAADTPVSPNCWGLLPTLLPSLEAGLIDFLARAGDDDEYYLPHAIDHHLAASGERLAVLTTPDEWLGLTYPGDAARVSARLADWHAEGRYPRRPGVSA